MTEKQTVEVRLTREEYDLIHNGLLFAVTNETDRETREKLYRLIDKMRHIRENDLLW